MSNSTELYFEKLIAGVRKEYEVANLAREKKLDPVNKVEIPLAMSLAEKCVGLISTVYPQLDHRVTERILELEKEYGALDVAVSFKIAEEIAREKFCKFESLMQGIDAGVRVGFAYNTLGVVSSPIEGFTGIKLEKTRDGKEYFKAYFSGPIRSAGTTASCVVLMLIDYLRETFGYAKWDPDEKEAKRYVTENYDYHERINNLQYLPTEEEILFLAKNLPIQIAGEPTEKLEVSNYKDLPRVETNFIRGGMCLCFSEGLAQKAQKGLRLWRATQAKGFAMTGWGFLDEYIVIHKKREKGTADASPTYIKDLVAGRPVYGHPSASGGFRFRYGRSRVAGFSATSIHPATMGISNNFLSTGTQLKIEKPTKGCVVTVCDSIDGPIVKLKDGSVRKLTNFEEAKKLYKDTEEIIYLGDILFPLGDVINRNYELLKQGYVEEWWFLELKKKVNSLLNLGEGVPALSEDEKEILKKYLEIDAYKVSFERASEVSDKLGLPLHPLYIYYWSQISKTDFFWLLDWMQNASWREKLVLPYEKSIREKFKEGKRALELLGVEHEVVFDYVVIKDGKAFLSNLGLDEFLDFKEIIPKIILEKKDFAGSVLELVNSMSKFKIKDKAGTFIGTRMGRPEKAKLRKLTGSPNTLFSIGEEGGRLRSVQAAVEKGFINADFPLNFCKTCNKETINRICETCNNETTRLSYCPECRKTSEIKCLEHPRAAWSSRRSIDSKYYFEKAVAYLGLKKEDIPELIKGVRGTSSADHDFENLAKGILRAKHNLCVNKDGTIRYDCTELPISHFKPKEIGTSVVKLRELGYETDCYGKELTNEDQILEIMPHDILLPCCPDTKDERADDVFLNIANFIDELLEKFYKLPKYYNLQRKEDLVGQLVVCMAPHNCAGVTGRIIGFAKAQGLFASPYMHAAMRRDCVYPSTGLIFEKEGRLRREKIGEYVEELIKNGAKIKKLDFYTERVEIKDEYFAYGLDINTNKLVRKKIKYFIRAKKPKSWIKIGTESGREQIMTESHDFFYLRGNKFDIKKARDIKKGDKIAVLIKYKDFVGKEIYDREFNGRDIRNEDGFEKKGDYFIDIIKDIENFEENVCSYCFDVENEERLDKNVLWGEGIINFRCDGDEAAIMMLMDVLMNFSRKFLPSHRGGTQDAPLVLNSKISAGEVDDQILDFELVSSYPLELYEMAEQGKHSSEIKIENVKKRLKEGRNNFENTGFTHNTSNFNDGVTNSSYKILPTMKDKVEKQMELCSKIRAVNANDVARLIIDRHFIRDIRGNLRKFAQQQFRCVKCNEKFRRPPMCGVCLKCGGKIIFTISEGSIVKYVEPAFMLAKKFDIPPYTKQGLELAKMYIESIFGKADAKQVEISKWF